MKIIIDIPKINYDGIKSYVEVHGGSYAEYLIANGIPQEEKQTNMAEWIKYPSDFSEYRCSKCRYEVFGGALKYAEAGEYKYCPNCGSEMKIEKEEEE